jgi:hypothetical protein
MRANLSPADWMSRSLRTSPVSLAAARWGARKSTHSRSNTAASLVSSKLIASSSKYFSEAMTRRAWVTNTAAQRGARDFEYQVLYVIRDGG